MALYTIISPQSTTVVKYEVGRVLLENRFVVIFMPKVHINSFNSSLTKITQICRNWEFNEFFAS